MKQTGYPHGRPGYVIDHRVPLACGGPDAPSNMQWQTVAAAKAKDKTERIGCRQNPSARRESPYPITQLPTSPIHFTDTPAPKMSSVVRGVPGSGVPCTSPPIPGFIT
jgi:hypothetical protein